MQQITLFKVFMSKHIDEPLIRTLHSGWVGQGNIVKDFESALGKRFNNDKVLTLSAGTHGLTLALMLLNIGKEDSIISTPLTCVGYNSTIETENGIITIGKIVNKKLNLKVKSINENNGDIEFKKITNWIKLPSPNNWFSIYLRNGHNSRSYKFGKRHIWITGDHKVLTKNGYKRVDSLNKNDLVMTDDKIPNSKQIEFINGTMLGDGHIQRSQSKGSYRMTFAHGNEQKEWIELKSKCFSGFNISELRDKIKERDGRKIYYFQTHASLSFKELHSKWYSSHKSKIIPNDLKLTPLTLATWYMDDGSLQDNSAVLCTESFYSEYFWELFYKLVELGLNPAVSKKNNGWRLYIGNGSVINNHNSANKFFKIISPYIIPSMRYKLPNNNDLDDFNEKLWDLGKAEVYYSEVIAEKNNPPKSIKPEFVYCIEVEDNHNFISKNMVLSNCTATNFPIILSGAEIIWADVKPDFNIDPASIEPLIQENTKAIFAVHWGGYPVDLKAIHEIAKKYNLAVVEDAAHAYGATYQDSIIGDCTYSDFTMMSFQAIKSLSSVDGGALFCKDLNHYKEGKSLRWFGIDREGLRADFRCENPIDRVGNKFHMNDINAIIGLTNMEEVEENIKITQENAEYYDRELNKISGIELTQTSRDRESSYWLYTIQVDKRSDFCSMMTSKGIAVSRVHERNDLHPCTKQFKRDLPGLESIIGKMICIPVGWWVTRENREYIVESIKKGW